MRNQMLAYHITGSNPVLTAQLGSVSGNTPIFSWEIWIRLPPGLLMCLIQHNLIPISPFYYKLLS